MENNKSNYNSNKSRYSFCDIILKICPTPEIDCINCKCYQRAFGK